MSPILIVPPTDQALNIILGCHARHIQKVYHITSFWGGAPHYRRAFAHSAGSSYWYWHTL